MSEGILERSGRIPRAHFAYSVLSDVATEAEGVGSDEDNTELFPKPLSGNQSDRSRVRSDSEGRGEGAISR